MYEGACLSLLVCKSDKKWKLVVYYVNLIHIYILESSSVVSRDSCMLVALPLLLSRY